jgi:hypothetical protein
MEFKASAEDISRMSHVPLSCRSNNKRSSISSHRYRAPHVNVPYYDIVVLPCFQ